MNTRLLHRSTINFALKSEVILSTQMTAQNLVVEINSLSRLKSNSAFFGNLQPLLFIREVGFVDGQNLQLKLTKNLIKIDSSQAVNYRLKLIPYRQINTQCQVVIHEILLPEGVVVANLNSNLFIGNI
ncbi:hypothetical protein HCU40_16575 [Pseudanabaena biceps]|nr:hypothetical protein [Pseudanabaena biceps]